MYIYIYLYIHVVHMILTYINNMHYSICYYVKKNVIHYEKYHVLFHVNMILCIRTYMRIIDAFKSTYIILNRG